MANLLKYDLPLTPLEELHSANKWRYLYISCFAGLNPTQLCQLTIILTKLIVVFEIITSFSEVKQGNKFS